MTWDQQQLLYGLLDCEDAGFTGWEIDFLNSLSQARDRNLSTKQLETLHRIAEKAGFEVSQ